MKNMERITIDPKKMSGTPCIRNLRMPVATIVGMVAEGMNKKDIVKDHPELEPEDVDAALEFAAKTLKERTTPSTI